MMQLNPCLAEIKLLYSFYLNHYNNYYNDLDEVNQSLESKLIAVTVTNITTDNFGFFGIDNKLKTYTDNGYKILNAYGKDGALTQNGSTISVIFSIGPSTKILGYGYLYKANGKTIEPLSGATNVTLSVIMMK